MTPPLAFSDSSLACGTAVKRGASRSMTIRQKLRCSDDEKSTKNQSVVATSHNKSAISKTTRRWCFLVLMYLAAASLFYIDNIVMPLRAGGGEKVVCGETTTIDNVNDAVRLNDRPQQRHLVTTSISDSPSLRQQQNNNNDNNIATKKANASVVDEIDSFYYIHVPKTGTSVYALLRNRLASCTLKDFTCFGVWGGGVLHTLSRDGRAHYPFDPECFGVGRNQVREIATCGGTLNCRTDSFWDRSSYHCRYSREICRRQRNKVTMFREPHEWFRSFFEWYWMHEMSTSPGSFSTKKLLDRYPPPMSFVTGKSGFAAAENKEAFLDDAFEILQNEYLWWGVTDFWSASVCVFHCELGGEERPSETTNFRSTAGHAWTKNATEFEATLPRDKHRSAFVSNYTKYVEDEFPEETVFYHTRIMPEFRKRASACGCRL